jgi:phosphoribosylformylglycinamidine (FGAM) synthase-like enzyme
MLGQVGLNVPRVYHKEFLPHYLALHRAIKSGLVSSCHAIARGGLAVHLALVAMGGGLGMTLQLPLVPAGPGLSNTQKLYSESCGRFVITVAPEMKTPFEECFSGMKLARVGAVTESHDLHITGEAGDTVLREDIQHLKASWKKPFGDFI